ncbi:glycosyltransferase [Bacteroides nordii]|uniref:glycosyltransferase n=1 Tax=Bacteroides nordii TaxID=291645 RepID=UPI0026DBDFC2|nr:glycosyltransferase [Bacteroides nordii]
MKILHLSTTDHLGGAAIAAYRLHKAMCFNGLNSQMLVSRKSLDKEDAIVEICPFKYYFRFVYKQLNKLVRYWINKRYGVFSLDMFGVNIVSHELVQNADIIYIHYVNDGMLSIRQLNKLFCLNKKYILVLHDMWPLTGGCHHSLECISYTRECRYCSHLKLSFKYDLSNLIFKLKKYYWGKYHDNVIVVAPSTWMLENIKKSSLFEMYKSVCIPNPIDLKIFFPQIKETSRLFFKLPLKEKLILFGASGGIDNPYKGWNEFQQSISFFPKNYCTIVVFGSNYCKEIQESLGQKVIFMGSVKEEDNMSMLYNAVDVFVSPSLADNLPSTLIEALACGIPVVSFNIGGIPDIIQHKENGYLAKYKDINDLYQGIIWAFMEARDKKDFTSNCYRHIENNYGMEEIIRKHLSLITNK